MDFVTFARTARSLTRQNSTTFPDQLMVDFVNLAKSEIEGRIVSADGGYLEMTAYADMVAGQRVYELPSDILNRVVKVEVKMDGENYYPMNEIDFNMIRFPISDEAAIMSYSSAYPVRYSLYRGSLYIWSGITIPAVSQGLMLYYNVSSHDWVTGDLSQPVDISIDPTPTSVGLPTEFHPVLLYMLTRKFKLTRDNPIALDAEEQTLALQAMLDDALANYQNANRDRIEQGELPLDLGYDY